MPYGVKSVATIQHFTEQIADFLLNQNVKLLIIACNTMAAVAAQVVRDLSPTPVLDVIEAGALAALAASRGRRIGVIGTPTTINSNAYARAIHNIEPDARLTSQACALLVPLPLEQRVLASMALGPVVGVAVHWFGLAPRGAAVSA